ncbi:abscission/NoCut checkpoint regulator [Zootermopsis nevadensis]|uniref:Zinc finger FYVE domain-containing protein 19 n=1 Tax=Zootermopsis nevadensis TaxID=136037 RepID=A0A067REZ5_ZOONE|nr:abscission/NoCut checkpoint regulator [Zootermopsis nevadensis]KDR17531.1 Zinc finger FYVE domain-containing protein 19 [Zootermopsis nevadensis]
MSCLGCSSKFTFFNKDVGCPNCGFSYCSKCLKLQIAVPKFGNSVCKVCKSCYGTLIEGNENPKSFKGEYCPPESFLRRLESLENPSRPPITLYRKDQHMQKLKLGLSEVDCKIAERLEKLREDRKQQPVPTEEEVARRLAKLKGEDPATVASLHGNRMSYIPPDTRTSQEKADSLVKQFSEEYELDSRQPDAVDEISQRLARLRGQDTSSGQTSAGDKQSGSEVVDTEESQDFMEADDVNAFLVQMQKEMKGHEMKKLDKDTQHCLKAIKTKLSAQTPTEEAENLDEEVEETIQKALHEVALEEELEDDSEGIEEEEELVWCVICDKNPKIRCLDCDGDVYCKSCYTKVHNEWHQDHRNVPFTPKK